MHTYADPMETAPAFDFAVAELELIPVLPEAPESAHWGAENRQLYLDSLPAHGFTAEQHQETVDQIVTTGLPVNNFASLHRRPNQYGGENWREAGVMAAKTTANLHYMTCFTRATLNKDWPFLPTKACTLIRL